MNLRDLTIARARVVRAAPRRTRARRGARVPSRTRNAEAHRPGPAPGRGAGSGARARFGPVPLAADECRDARGTAFVDNTVRDILYAFRTFQRAPLVAFTIVSTVALGLGLVAVVFTLLNALLFRVDQVPDVHEMFAVERPRTADGERRAFHARAIRRAPRETSVFTDVYASCRRYRHPYRRAHDVGHVRHGQLLPGARRQRRDGTRADASRRRASRGTTGDGPQPPRMGPAVCARPEHSRSRPARQWRHVRDRRRHARGISRSDRRTRRLLGAALDARSRSPDPSRPRSAMSRTSASTSSDA